MCRYDGGWSNAFGALDADFAARGQWTAGIAVGGAHTVVLSNDGRVYTWGWGDRGQLGRGGSVAGASRAGGGGSDADILRWPAAAGGAASADGGSVSAASARSTVHDGSHAPHGPDEEEAARPGLVSALLFPPEEVAAQMSGSAHGASLGRKTKFGGGSLGSSGVLHRLRVKQVAAGEDHTVALSHSGRVYTWGCSKRGQLGLGPEVQACYKPRLVSSLRRPVAEVGAGALHTVALVVAGSVYTWGAGPMLGLGVFTGSGDRALPNAVRALTKHRVRHVSCGWRFTVATTHGGDVYTWGSGTHGQLGHGDTRDRLVPAVVAALSGNHRHSRIAVVAAGARHCVAMSATTRLYSWGWNAFGQLGLGDQEDRSKPVWIQHARLRRVWQVTAGWRHTAVLTETGDMAAWGCTGAVRTKRLAHDPDRDNTHFVVSVPTEVPFHAWPGRVAQSLCVGSSDTISVTCCVYTQAPVTQSQLEHGGMNLTQESDVAGYAAAVTPGAVANGATRIGTEAAVLVAEASGDFQAVAAMTSGTKGAESNHTNGRAVAGSATGRGNALVHTPIRATRKANGSAAPSPSPSGSVAARLAALSPAELKHLSAAQLRLLVASLQAEQQQADSTTHRSSPLGAASKGSAPRKLFKARGAPTSDPVQQALESGWMAHFTGKTTPADGMAQRRAGAKAAAYAAPTVLNSESAARTELLAFHAYAAGTVATPRGGLDAMSPRTASGAPPTPAAGATLRTRPEATPAHETPRQRAERKAALAAARRARQAEERARQRAERERKAASSGDTVSNNYFSTAHLVATSNEDMSVGDVIAQYGLRVQSHESQPLPSPGWSAVQRSAAVDGSRRGVTVRSLLGDPSDGDAPPPTEAAPTPHIKPAESDDVSSTGASSWSGRRPSRVHSVHRKIEDEVLQAPHVSATRSRVAVPPPMPPAFVPNAAAPPTSFSQLQSRIDSIREVS